MPIGRALPLLAVVALAGACSAITSFDGFVGDGPDAQGDGGDGGAGDGGAVADARPSDGASGADTGLDPDAGAGFLPVRLIRCGVAQNAPPYMDSLGRSWGGDVDFDVGTIVTNTDMTTGTPDPALYLAERYASRVMFPAGFKYTFNGLSSGSYVVKLHFVESTSAPVSAPGQRRFDVAVDGTKVLTELDIFAEAGGKRRALVKALPVTVTGTSMVIAFTPGSAENPKVNAIEVLRKP